MAKRRGKGAYERAKQKPLGEGSRFKAVAGEVRKAGASNPDAVAGAIMWKKYGKKKGSALIRKGKRDAKKG